MAYRTNGEYWYRDALPLLSRVRRWVVAFGGWETPHWSSDGYSYRWSVRNKVRLALRARGRRTRTFALYSSLCPVSLFGGRLTFQPFGVNWWSRRRQAWYCLHYGYRGTARKRWHAYRSHNATPWGADTWYAGAPVDVIRAATQQAARMIDADAARARVA